MTGLNRATLIGHLGRDPEVRHTNDGKPVVTLSLATSESWRDKRSGERVEKTEWHRITIFNENLCKIAEQYLKKGAQVFIEGKLQTRKWTDKDNVERYTTEIVVSNFDGRIVLLGGKGGDRKDDVDAAFAGTTARASSSPATGGKSLSEDLDDEIPF